MGDYYDGEGIKRSPGEEYYDGEGIKRYPDEEYYDSEGIKRSPGEQYYDGEGIKRYPGESFYDSEGIKRYPGEEYYDGEGIKKSFGDYDSEDIIPSGVVASGHGASEDNSAAEIGNMGLNGFILAVPSIFVAVMLLIFRERIFELASFAFRWLYLPLSLVIYGFCFNKLKRGGCLYPKRIERMFAAGAIFTLSTFIIGRIYLDSPLSGIKSFIFFVLCFLPLGVYGVALLALSADINSRMIAQDMISAARGQMMGLMIYLEMLTFLRETEGFFYVAMLLFSFIIVGVISYFLAWLAAGVFDALYGAFPLEK